MDLSIVEVEKNRHSLGNHNGSVIPIFATQSWLPSLHYIFKPEAIFQDGTATIPQQEPFISPFCTYGNLLILDS